MKSAETVEVVEVGSPLPTVSAPPMSVTAPVVDVPPVVVEDDRPAPGRTLCSSARRVLRSGGSRG